MVAQGTLLPTEIPQRFLVHVRFTHEHHLADKRPLTKTHLTSDELALVMKTGKLNGLLLHELTVCFQA